MITVLVIIAIVAAVVIAAFFLEKRKQSEIALPTGPPPGFTGIPAALPFDLVESVRYHANRTGVDPSLVWGIVQTESSGNPNAQNPLDPSFGLMQVTPLIGRTFGNLRGSDSEVGKQLLDPETNLGAGTGFVVHLRDRYAWKFPVEEWIQAYNVGETKFDRGVRMTSYGSKVLRNAATWRG